MYALAIVRYRRPLEDVIANQDAHRAYLRGLFDDGVLLASGPFDPRTGGAAIFRVPDDDVAGALDRLRDGDPFTKLGNRAVGASSVGGGHRARRAGCVMMSWGTFTAMRSTRCGRKAKDTANATW